LQGPTHAYFADSTVKAYIFDKNNDGTIDPADGDTVILVFGLRRGSGKDVQPTQGLYYALDVSNPTQPKFIWSIGNNRTLIGTTNTITALFGDMGESWSEPKIVKIKLGTTDKIVALFGGGYDNCNEDSRYGSTQTFSGACGAVASSDGGLDVNGLPITSAGAILVTTLNSAQYKGRAFYIVEIASKVSTTTLFDYSNKGSLIWSYTQASSPPLEFSMMNEPAVIDKNFDGYADTVYMGDTGGNIWRFDISSSNKTDWNVKKIFSSNPGFTGYPPPGAADGTNGRKILFNPSVVIDKNFVRLFFGTGDREHPLNRAVVDRLYEVIDKGNITSALNEGKLVDVSTDLIQLGTAAQVAYFEQRINEVEDKDNTTYYGWYIRMEGFEHLSADQVFSAGTLTVAPFQGEKAISSPRVFNGIVYFTTFMPNTDVAVDPCNQGNTGQSFLWALNPQYGSSILNLNTYNDSTSNYNALKWNSYSSMGKSGNAVYLRTDRAGHLGTGMASPPGEIMGCSGSLCPSKPDLSGHVLQIYWRQK
jgi:type IV pilus assembly protein PilY1